MDFKIFAMMLICSNLIESKLQLHHSPQHAFGTWFSKNNLFRTRRYYDNNGSTQTIFMCMKQCDWERFSAPISRDNICLYDCLGTNGEKLYFPTNVAQEKSRLLLLGTNKAELYSVSDCHQKCPWSTHCDKCPNCKWCWLCSSCSFPRKECEYCSVCNGKLSDCVKCCGYHI